MALLSDIYKKIQPVASNASRFLSQQAGLNREFFNGQNLTENLNRPNVGAGGQEQPLTSLALLPARYLANQAAAPITSGIAEASVPRNTTGQKIGVAVNTALPIAQGVFNATPAGMAFNTKQAIATGAAKTIRQGQPLNFGINSVNALSRPTSFAKEGLGVQNELAAGLIDVAAGNPRGTLNAVRSIPNIKTAADAAKVAAMIPGFGSQEVLKGGNTFKNMLTKSGNYENLANAFKGAAKSTRNAAGKFSTKGNLSTVPLRESVVMQALNEGENLANVIDPYANLNPTKEARVFVTRDLNNPDKGVLQAHSESEALQKYIEQRAKGNVVAKITSPEARTTADFQPKPGEQAPAELMALKAKPGTYEEAAQLMNANKQGIAFRSKPTVEEKLPVNAKELNVNRLNVSKETKQALAEVADNTPLLKNAKGAPITRKEVVKQAELLADQSNGNITRDEALQFQAKMTATRQRLAGAAEASGGKVTPDLKKALIEDAQTSKFLASALSNRAIEVNPSNGTVSPVIMYARELAKHGQDIEEVLNRAEASGVNFEDPKQAASFYREFVKPNIKDWVDMVRYNSMLSSPNTFINNASSNTLTSSVLKPLEKMSAGVVDFLASSGKGQTHFAGEGPAYAKAYFSAVRDASKAFADSLSGKSMSGNFDTRSISLYPKGGVVSNVESVLKAPTALLEATDQFFTKLASAGEEGALNYKASKGVSVDGSIQDLAKQKAAYTLYRQDTHAPGQGQLLNSIDDFTTKIDSLRQSNNPITSNIAKFTVPFLKTPMNIFKQGIEYSPLGFATVPGSADKIEQINKAVFGSAIFAAASTLLSSGRSTWAAPQNGTNERKLYDEAGMQPYSVKVGDKWIAYNKLPPQLAYPLALVSALDDAKKNGKITDTFIDQVLSSVSKYGGFLADQSYAQGIGNLLSAVKGSPGSLAKITSGYGQQLFPYRAFSGWFTRLVDSQQRQVDTSASTVDQLVQSFMMQVPGLSKNVPAKTDQLGNPLQANNNVVNAFSPVKISNSNQAGELNYNAFKQQQILNRNAEAQKQSLVGNASTNETSKLVNGKYAYRSSDGTVKTARTQELADLGKAKEDVISGAKDRVQVGKYIVSSDPESSSGYKVTDVEALKQKMKEKQIADSATSAKDKGDYKSWETAQKDLYTIYETQKRKLDPELEIDKIAALEDKQKAILKNVVKYRGYGNAFKKPKKGRKVSNSIPRVKAPKTVKPVIRSPKRMTSKIK